MMQHGELVFAIAIDEAGVGEKVDEVVDVFIERAQEPGVIVSPPLEQLLRFQFTRVAEVADQHMAHLPAVALFFAHDAQQTLAIVVRRRGIDQLALLLR